MIAATLLGAALSRAEEISADRIRAHVKFLASDVLEGRGVGARGGDIATEYLATQFALAGAKPAGDNGTYFQRVPLVGVETQPGAELTAAGKGGKLTFRWLDDFVGVSHLQIPETHFDAEAVFVGHGITAPEFNWNDFKNVDVRGKLLVLFTNEPASTDLKFFGGPALTYYGRWTYKYEEATRKGALGVLIIHTTPTAGYGWEVVRNSWGREQPFVKLGPGEPALSLAGWLTRDAGEKLLALSGHSVDELLKAADSRDFRPIPLGIRIAAGLPSKVRSIETRNVAAVVAGSDPKLKDEAVLFTAHWDHLGIGPPVDGDAIYNGAVDNATGCGILLELARAWAALPEKPRRSALFLAVTAEEGGLRGSEFYGAHPLFATGKTAVALNYDAIFPAGRTTDVVVSGAERTTFWPQVQQIAKRMDLTIKPDPRPEQGSYYRSDHFSLARVGIPAFTVGGGSDFVGKPAGFSDELFKEFNARHYHEPSDEFHEDWDFSGLAQKAQFGLLLGLEAANQDTLPTWNAGDEFLAARQKSRAADGGRRKIFPYAYTQEDLPNGLRVITVPTDFPNIVALFIVVQTGSRNEVEPGHTGFAHLFEHVMFRGTEKFPPEKYEEALKKAGAASNAFTSDDLTAYHTTFSKEDLEGMLAMEADRFQNLKYTEPVFRTETLAVLGEYNKNSADPLNKLNEVLQDTAFDRHTYKHTTMGFLKDIEDMPNQYGYSLKFFDRYYRPEYTTIVVVGDAQPQRVRPLVEKYWGNWKHGSYKAEIAAEPPQTGPRAAKVDWPSRTLPWIDVAYKAPAYTDTEGDSAALDALAFLAFSSNSELYQKLVVQEQKVDTLMGGAADRVDPGLFEILARVKNPADMDHVRDQILGTVRQFREKPVPRDRLEAVKSHLRYAFSLRMDNSETIAIVVARYVTLRRTPETINRLYDRYAQLTPEDIQAAAGKFLIDNGRTIITLAGPAAGGAK